LELNKSVDDNAPMEGQLVNYTLVITNKGPFDAHNISVQDTLAAGLTYDSHTPPLANYNPATGLWDLGDLDENESVSLVIRARVDVQTSGQTIVNVAKIVAHDELDPDESNNSDAATIAVKKVDLGISKTVSDETPIEDQDITYTLTLTNNGPGDATGVEVTDQLPAGVTYDGSIPSQGTYNSGSGVWTVNNVANGSSATLLINASVDGGTSGQTITNSAAVTGLDQLDDVPGNDSDTAPITVNKADLGISKTVDDATPDEDQEITYTVTLTNNGPGDATGVEVTDQLPAGVTYVSSDPSQGTYNIFGGVWTLVDDIASGNVATLTLTVTVDGSTSGETITNSAAVTALDQFDDVPGNDSDTAPITVN
jgi:uncharacterized repeat protein (TIGR01451 family)